MVSEGVEPVDLELHLEASAGAFAVDLHARVLRGPVALVGPNGAGKTTLLRMLAGGLRPTRGRVLVRGRCLLDTAAGRFLDPEARGVGYLPQGYGLFGHLSALDNVAYGVRAASRGERRARAQQGLAELGVAHCALRKPGQLSGGEQQRVALARALATSPSLLLLDEPTASLDVAVRREIRALLHGHLHDPARVAIVVTHDLRDLLAWQPTVIFVAEGRVVAQGTVEELRAQAGGHPFLAELLSLAGSP